MNFEIYQLMNVVFFREARDKVIFMLIDSLYEITSHADVQSAISLAGHDIYVVLLHFLNLRHPTHGFQIKFGMTEPPSPWMTKGLRPQNPAWNDTPPGFQIEFGMTRLPRINFRARIGSNIAEGGVIPAEAGIQYWGGDEYSHFKYTIFRVMLLFSFSTLTK